MGDERVPEKKSKTVLFVVAPPSTYIDPSTFDNTDLSNINLGGGRFFPIVAHFCYLGSILTRDCKDDEDVKARIDAASGAFGALRKSVFSNASICLEAKRLVYEGLILAILLYGSESWCLTESSFDKLRAFHARCTRAMCRVDQWHTHKHRITTDELLERLDLKHVDSYVTKWQLQWTGHVMRMFSIDYQRR